MKSKLCVMLTVVALAMTVAASAQETTEKIKDVISREDVTIEAQPGVKLVVDASTSPTTAAVVPPSVMVNRVTEIVCLTDDNQWNRYYITVRPIEGLENSFQIVRMDGLNGKEIVRDFSKEANPEAAKRQQQINASWAFCQIGFQLRFEYDEEEQQLAAEGKTPPAYVGPSDMLYRYVEPQESNPYFAQGVLNVNPLGEYFYGIAIYDLINGEYVKKPLKETDVSKFVEYVTMKKQQKIPWDDLNRKWAQEESFHQMPYREGDFGVMMDYWHEGAYHIYPNYSANGANYYGDDGWGYNHYYSDSRRQADTHGVRATSTTRRPTRGGEVRRRYNGGPNTPASVVRVKYH